MAFNIYFSGLQKSKPESAGMYFYWDCPIIYIGEVAQIFVGLCTGLCLLCTDKGIVIVGIMVVFGK